MNDEILTVKSVAAYLSLHPATVYRLARAGVLPAFRIGTEWRFSQKAIDQWVATQHIPVRSHG